MNVPQLSDRQQAAEERKANRHWIVRDLFNEAHELGLHSPSFQPLSQKIQEKTGMTIPAGTLKYWHDGHSTPKIDEVDAIAKTLEYELDLMKGEGAPTLKAQPNK